MGRTRTAARILFWIGICGLITFLLAKSWHYEETRLLPYYIFRTFLRVTLTYFLCLLIGVSVGVWISRHAKASSIIIPLTEALESMPIMGILPFILAFFISTFNESLIGLEISAIILLFLSMIWPIIFGTVAGMSTIPDHIKDLSSLMRLSRREHFTHIVLPSIYPQLITSSSIAWKTGWYFSLASEIISYNRHSFNLSGIGYFLHQATEIHHNILMALLGIFSLGLVVYLINVNIWRRLEESSKEYKYIVLNLGFRERPGPTAQLPAVPRENTIRKPLHSIQLAVQRSATKNLSAYIVLGMLGIATILATISNKLVLNELAYLLPITAYSMLRIAIGYALCIIAVLFLLYMIILFPKIREPILTMSSMIDAVPHFATLSFLMLITTAVFPTTLAFEITAIAIIALCMFDYIMSHVSESMTYLPGQLSDIGATFNMNPRHHRFKYLRHVLLPALLPAILLGSMLAIGAGWNSIIVAEYIIYEGEQIILQGLGSTLQIETNRFHFINVLFIITYISGIIYLLNHVLLKKLLQKQSAYRIGEEIE